MKLIYITTILLFVLDLHGCKGHDDADLTSRSSKKTDEDNEEVAISPANITGTFLNCSPVSRRSSSGQEAIGCNVVIQNKDSKSLEKTQKVALSKLTGNIKWGYQGKARENVTISRNKDNYHVILYSDQPIKNTGNIKLEWNQVNFQNKLADFIISSPLGNVLQSKILSDNKLLPDVLDIYLEENNSFSTVPSETGELRKLPAVNSYRYTDGCYLACYGKSEEGRVYPVAPDIFVKGLYRVKGFYKSGGNVCHPNGYYEKDISKVKRFKEECKVLIQGCKNDSCWVGGETRMFLYK